MGLWTAQEVSEALGLDIATSWEATGISIDSRTVAKGDIFIALKGDYCDGHDYINQAIEKGAVAVIAEKGDNVIEVGNSYKALEQLASYRRVQCQAHYVAVTGSVGKTSTKETIFHMLEAYGSTYATQGNLNNHIGLPLSLARMPKETRYAIFEIGMNHAGEIRPLTCLLQPHMAIITNVASVHLENFSSEEEIAKAKAEIMEGVLPQGVVILNHDNRHYDYLKHCATGLNLEVVSFGGDESCDIERLSYEADAKGLHTALRVKGEKVTCHIPLWNLASIEHVMIALAVVKELALPLEKAVSSLSTLTQGRGRGEVVPCQKWTIIDDSYNASPLSVTEALQTLRQYQEIVAPKARKVAIIGDMLELGEDSLSLHQGLSKAVMGNQIDRVFTVGKVSQALLEELPEAIRGKHFDSSENVAGELQNYLEDGDIILIKGSRGIKTERIINQLQENNAL